MKRFNRQEIDEVIQKSDIVNVIGQYVKLEPSGKNFRCLCPFHDDHNPSMSVSPQHQLFHCFSCGAKGNVANFVQRFEKIEFNEVIYKLAKLNGIDVKDIDQVDFYSQQEQLLIPIYECLKTANDVFVYQLKHQSNPEVLNFIEARKLEINIIDEFKIGFCANDFNLYEYLKAKGFSHQTIMDSNLVIENEHGFYSFLNNRIIFPIIDRLNRVVGFSARALNNQSNSKYINSSSAKHFQKSKILYNYQNCLNDNGDVVYVCEGVMDVIALNKAGIKKAVATLGTAFTLDHVDLLKRLKTNVCLCFDSDSAGLKATYNAGILLKEAKVKFQIVDNQSGLDPDEIINQHGLSGLENTLNQRISWYDFLINYAITLFGNNDFDSKMEIVSFIAKNSQIDNNMELTYVINLLSEKIGFDSEDLKKELATSISHKKTLDKPKTKILKVDNKVLLCEKQIIAHLLLGKYYSDLYLIKINGLIHPEMNALALKIIEYYKNNDEMVVATLLNSDLSQLMQDVIIEVTTSELFKYEKTDNTFVSNVNMVLSQRKKNNYYLLSNKLADNSNHQDTLELLKKLMILKKS